MAITWAGARTKVRGDLWRPGSSGIPDDVCDRALHASILELEGERRWLWLENIAISGVLPDATDRIACPNDLSSAQSLCFRYSEDGPLDPPLEQITLGRLRVMASDAGSGAPAFYCISDGTIYLDQLAPAGSSFELIYTSRTPDDLGEAVAAGDANQTLQKQETAVVALACHYVCLNYLRNNEEATRKLAVFQRILERLTNREDEQRGDLHGGEIVPDQTYAIMAGGYC